jgi:hypothetical protein
MLDLKRPEKKKKILPAYFWTKFSNISNGS